MQYRNERFVLNNQTVALRMVADYYAPHKLQPTTRKLHRARKAWDQLRSSTFGRTRPVFGGRV